MSVRCSQQTKYERKFEPVGNIFCLFINFLYVHLNAGEQERENSSLISDSDLQQLVIDRELTSKYYNMLLVEVIFQAKLRQNETHDVTLDFFLGCFLV